MKKDNKINKQPTKEKKNIKKKQDKELFWILGVMIGLIAVFLIASAIFQSFQSIEYESMTFTKEKVGEIDFFVHSYLTDKTVATGRVVDGGELKPVVLYFRVDPRENDVPVEGGEISFYAGKKIFIGIGDDLEECKYSTVAIAGATSFLTQNGFKVEAGLTDGKEAKENNLPYVKCSLYENNPVIIFQKGEKTEVRVVNDLCYEVTANNCEILPAAEKFVLQSIIDARESSKA